jgi:S1-C subfamily serine protease
MLTEISDRIADVVAEAAPSVVQVQGRRRPASGVVYQTDAVLTTARALGREDRLIVRDGRDRGLDAELAGWDPATGLALLRVPGGGLPPATPGATAARVGHFALAVARSWSNAVTASAGIVSVIGGPMPTGRGRSIEQVIRVNAPMHDGFAGGAVLDAAGALMGIATAATIRGLGVVIPASIAWQTAAALLQHGTLERGYLGLAGVPVRLSESQREKSGVDGALLLVHVKAGSPAAEAGLLVGDVILTFDGQPVETPEDLLQLLSADRVGRLAVIGILRGAASTDVSVLVQKRPGSQAAR